MPPRRPGRYFGTDGFRGEVGVTLTAEHAWRIGRFLGWYYKRRAEENGNPAYRVRAAIGKDPRLSSYLLEYAIAAGFNASGANAYLLHVTTTPSVSFVTRSEGFDCGVMISASHNPFFDNGIKLVNRAGEKTDLGILSQAEDYLDGILPPDCAGDDLPLARGEDIGRTVDYTAGRNRYIGYLISLATFSLRGMKVGLDCANGSAWSIARTVFDALGATTYLINASPDGTNINRNAGSTHPEGLSRLVRDRGLSIGFAFDGDADRCIAVDGNGRIVDGAGILYAVGRSMKSRGLLEGSIVSTVMANRGFERALAELQIPLIRTPVGDKYVYAAMTEHGCNLGGEPSGHLIFPKYATTGDGILTALVLLEVLREEKQTLAEAVAAYRPYPEVHRNVSVKNPAAVVAREAVTQAVARAEQALGTHGRVLVRASGTEPVVRILVEAEESDVALSHAKALEKTIREEGR